MVPPGSTWSVKDVVEKLKDIVEPPGMIREIIIIGNTVFSVTKEHLQLFSKERVRLDPMDDLPSGSFPASEYATRLYVEDGRVVFIELFREAPVDERDEFVSEMKRSLRDLTKLGI